MSRYDAEPDGEDDLGGFELDTEAEVVCPYCGETVTVELDPGGGSDQEYVQDCEVCCRPWQVTVHFDESGQPTISVEPA
jgi:hypothetical protein